MAPQPRGPRATSVPASEALRASGSALASEIAQMARMPDETPDASARDAKLQEEQDIAISAVENAPETSRMRAFPVSLQAILSKSADAWKKLQADLPLLSQQGANQRGQELRKELEADLRGVVAQFTAARSALLKKFDGPTVSPIASPALGAPDLARLTPMIVLATAMTSSDLASFLDRLTQNTDLAALSVTLPIAKAKLATAGENPAKTALQAAIVAALSAGRDRNFYSATYARAISAEMSRGAAWAGGVTARESALDVAHVAAGVFVPFQPPQNPRAILAAADSSTGELMKFLVGEGE